MHDLGVRLAGLLRAGDLVVLSGDLGAGKTTLTQGIGEGLKVRGPITSPTFVIARVHPSLSDGPPLVHVDAYRLNDLAEVDDLDLDASLDDAVTIVEWGEGMVEDLSTDRLEIRLTRSNGDQVRDGGPDESGPDESGPDESGPDESGPDESGPDESGERIVRFAGIGARWTGVSVQ
ncbi:MAG TPA: tRNA (adenosine(37)-N6)-threonylcarbamoyltransferase complex ATPase subunit type 1 TsaE [Streptosporangiaceae bacterium]